MYYIICAAHVNGRVEAGSDICYAGSGPYETYEEAHEAKQGEDRLCSGTHLIMCFWTQSHVKHYG